MWPYRRGSLIDLRPPIIRTIPTMHVHLSDGYLAIQTSTTEGYGTVWSNRRSSRRAAAKRGFPRWSLLYIYCVGFIPPPAFQSAALICLLLQQMLGDVLGAYYGVPYWPYIHSTTLTMGTTYVARAGPAASACLSCVILPLMCNIAS